MRDGVTCMDGQAKGRVSSGSGAKEVRLGGGGEVKRLVGVVKGVNPVQKGH